LLKKSGLAGKRLNAALPFTCRPPEAARLERNERKRSRARRPFDTARMSPASVPRRGTAQAPASASESNGNRAGREVAVAAGAVAVLAALAAATRNATSNRARRASSPPRRVAVAVQPRPGGVIAFEASAPVVAAEHAWLAARAAALGELAPGTQLSDVQSVEVLERKKNVAVVRQDARWRVGPASGVARVTVRARVDDASRTVAFELVGGSLDAFSSSSSSHAIETETKNAGGGGPGCLTQKKKKHERAPGLAAYTGVLGVANGAVYMRGAAVVAPAAGIAQGLATRFAARVLRGQITRSVADVAAVADARARARN
jgi:hypothetical protein